jgi:hypothetical protein
VLFDGYFQRFYDEKVSRWNRTSISLLWTACIHHTDTLCSSRAELAALRIRLCGLCWRLEWSAVLADHLAQVRRGSLAGTPPPLSGTPPLSSTPPPPSSTPPPLSSTPLFPIRKSAYAIQQQYNRNSLTAARQGASHHNGSSGHNNTAAVWCFREEFGCGCGRLGRGNSDCTAVVWRTRFSESGIAVCLIVVAECLLRIPSP